VGPTIARWCVALVGVLLGAMFCLPPAAKLVEIIQLWWYWHAVPGASINNIDDLYYQIGPFEFRNGVSMYLAIFGQIGLGIVAMGASVIMLFQPRRER
jgi:hypothetical protein